MVQVNLHADTFEFCRPPPHVCFSECCPGEPGHTHPCTPRSTRLTGEVSLDSRHSGATLAHVTRTRARTCVVHYSGSFFSLPHLPHPLLAPRPYMYEELQSHLLVSTLAAGLSAGRLTGRVLREAALLGMRERAAS